MAPIPRQRDIFDRKAVMGELARLVGWSGYGPKTQGLVHDIFKQALVRGQAEIRRRFEEEALPGMETVRANAFHIDQLVRVLHDFAVTHVYPAANPTTGEQLAIVATGGYGRGELAPHSDVDLMFVLPYKRTAHTEQVVEFMLYRLWDLGLKVGHATRSVDEALRLAGEDITIRTSLLESRWLWGDQDLYAKFKSRFAAEVVAGTGPAFVEAKLAERNARHDRMGDTRYVLEPNIKEGKGGLRDLQTLFWIAKYLYQVEDVGGLVAKGVLTTDDVRHFAKAENFLWTVRCHLHYLTGRPEERLTFNIQETVGKRMRYRDHGGARGVERFMKHYFLIAKTVGDLTRILCAVLEEDNKARRFSLTGFSLPFRKRQVDGFKVDGGRLTVANENDFATDPVKLLGLFHSAQHHGLDIHPAALRLVTQNLNRIDRALHRNDQANRLFMEMLTSKSDPEMALKRLNEAGVFGRFIPDFGRVVAQMQYDMYHVYTVDEHTIRAIGVVHGIESGALVEDHPVSCEVVGEVQSRQVLYLAVLLHDIAKGRGGDHSELGAAVALKLAPRLGLNDWETETVSWLVRHHLLMSRTAFKRDMDDAKTVTDFVEVVQSPERLRLLLVLTVADIRAVGPGVWNGWKATLLRNLYYRAMEIMTGGLPAERRSARVGEAQDRLRQELADWPGELVEEQIARGYVDYWLGFDTATHSRHARVIRDAEERKLRLHIETRVDPSRDATELIIYTDDHAGLFSQIAGAMALGGATIVDARIVTLTTGMALDTFWVQNSRGGAFENPDRLKKLWTRIEDSIMGRIAPARELEKARRRALPSRTGVFTVPPRVLIDNKASTNHTVIEVNGRDRLGFLHDVTAALTALGLQIASAHVSTYGERVVDVFYVKDVFGLKAEGKDKVEAMRKGLLAAIETDGSKKQSAAAAE